ncbi:MAG: D-alanine--D-alanine ligase [Crocinitomicaceae bacterium]|jgi:D-alanine-D-alanine ligase|nr:D-alanine--D-alanine ligase [Crocinitomicaceae bacterium]
MQNIGIFCGGFSSEFEISVKSANTILNHFPDNYNPFLIEVRQEKWTALYKGGNFDFDPWQLSFEYEGQEIRLDRALIYIHGNPGENGKLQAFLEMKGVPFINSGALASELSFDKWYCNQFLKSFDIPVAKSVLLRRDSVRNPAAVVAELGLPCFVKPADSGSSFGISKVKTQDELLPALELAFKEGESVVIEAFLAGTEVTCGVYRSAKGVYALPLTEIASENEFFDYEAKYLGKSQEITPARVSDEIRDKVQACAKRIYSLMNLRSIARIDFMVVDGVPHVIEVNTTPGFSPASIVPQMIASDGNDIKSFWTEILEVELRIKN